MSLSVRAFLARTDFFGHLEEDILEQLAVRCRPCILARGQVLFRQGDEGDSVYVVVYGRLSIWHDRAGRLGDVLAGEYLGEMAVLRGETRSATVRADRDSSLLQLCRADFLELLRRSPESALKLALSNIERLAERQRGKPPSAERSLTLVPLGTVEHGAEIAERLTAELQNYGPWRIVGPNTLQEELGDPDPDGAGGVEWLNRLEAEHRLVYLADPQLTPWTRRCLRQADSLLLLAQGNQARAPGPAEAFWQQLGGGPPHLLLQHSQARPGGSAAWLGDRQAQIHHLGPATAADLARVARLLMRQARVLVLGGGGARGMAHLGVLRALHERGLPVDACGGTSMGALVAVLYALHGEPEGVRRDLRRMFLERGSLFDFGFPLVSLVRARRLRRALEEVLGELDMVDLRLPCFTVCADLSAARPVVHTRGALGRAVAASMAIPGVVPPVVEGGHLFVDGAVLDNLPVAHARSLGWGSVWAVSVDVGTELLVEGQPYQRPLLTQLFEQIHPWRRRSAAPNLLHILVRSATLGRDRSLVDAGQSADVLIHPDVSGYGMFDWHRLEELAEAGYRAALAALG